MRKLFCPIPPPPLRGHLPLPLRGRPPPPLRAVLLLLSGLSSSSQGLSSSSQGPSSSSQGLSSSPQQGTSFSSEVYHTLYLLDCFGVSDSFYHELSMIYPSLERSYKIKEARSVLNSQVDKTTQKWLLYRPLKECNSS